MVRLLVSVIEPEEVPAALEGGADIVDVKNPREGSLGAPQPTIVERVRARVRPPQLVSVALGDAPHLPGTLALAARGAAACGADLVKVGLAAYSPREGAATQLRSVREAVPQAVKVVAVAYADAHRIGGLLPHHLLEAARGGGVDGVMLDTAQKDSATLWDFVQESWLRDWIAKARSRGLLCALAGSLRLADLPRLVALSPDVVGFRGAVTDGGRTASLVRSKVAALRAELDRLRGSVYR
jgi:uncharacterized protein (UPF0264 family)